MVIGEDVEDRGNEARGAVRPGELSALLRELAALPTPDPVEWQVALRAGAVLGRFELVRELGRGGLGVVWEAKDRELGRRVAFKAVRAGGRRDLREERLLREAEAAARLSHPNIVTLHDVGRTDQGPYLVLELLEGETLARRLTRGRLAPREALHVGIEIARGVAHAHAHGVVHRDLKPANVFLCEDGRVKVLDFGLAHAFGHDRVHGGTPGYMAPEQKEAAPEDERSDVFAMGAMLFEMLSGRLAFPPSDGPSAGSAQDARELAAVRIPALGEVVGRMLEKDPARRTRDGKEVLESLLRVEAALEPPGGAARRRGRLRWTGISIVAGALLGAALALLVVRREAAVRRQQPIVVAVADFANQTGEPNLDGMSGLLITSLEQSERLRVLTRGRLIELVREMGKPEAPRIDESLARAVGRKAGVRALLLASVRKLGNTYAAEVRAVDPGRDEYLFTVRDEAATANDLLPLIDRLSERTRIALSEPDSEVTASDVNVGEAVTHDLEAYRHYFTGKDLAARYRLKEAVAEFERALEIDHGFALARVDLAWIGFFSGGTRIQARDTIREAAQGAMRAPDKEARLIRILGAFFDGRFAAGRTEIRSALERYPEDRDVAVLAAEVLTWSGYYEEAAAAFERAFRLAPDWDLLRFDQVAVLNYVGKGREALAAAEPLVRQRPTGTTRAVLGVARLMAGDLEAGTGVLEQSDAEGGFPLQILPRPGPRRRGEDRGGAPDPRPGRRPGGGRFHAGPGAGVRGAAARGAPEHGGHRPPAGRGRGLHAAGHRVVPGRGRPAGRGEGAGRPGRLLHAPGRRDARDHRRRAAPGRAARPDGPGRGRAGALAAGALRSPRRRLRDRAGPAPRGGPGGGLVRALLSRAGRGRGREGRGGGRGARALRPDRLLGGGCLPGAVVRRPGALPHGPLARPARPPRRRAGGARPGARAMEGRGRRPPAPGGDEGAAGPARRPALGQVTSRLRRKSSSPNRTTSPAGTPPTTGWRRRNARAMPSTSRVPSHRTRISAASSVTATSWSWLGSCRVTSTDLRRGTPARSPPERRQRMRAAPSQPTAVRRTFPARTGPAPARADGARRRTST